MDLVPTKHIDMKVSGDTDPKSLATVIVCSLLNEEKSVVLSAVGPTAGHVIMKAIAASQEHAGPRGYLIGAVPSFRVEKASGEERDVMVIKYAIHKLRPLAFAIVPAMGV